MMPKTIIGRAFSYRPIVVLLTTYILVVVVIFMFFNSTPWLEIIVTLLFYYILYKIYFRMLDVWQTVINFLRMRCLGWVSVLVKYIIIIDK